MTCQAFKSHEYREALIKNYGDGLRFLTEPEFDKAVLGVSIDGRISYDAVKIVSVIGTLLNKDTLDAHAYLELSIIPILTHPRDPVLVWLEPYTKDMH